MNVHIFEITTTTNDMRKTIKGMGVGGTSVGSHMGLVGDMLGLCVYELRRSRRLVQCTSLALMTSFFMKLFAVQDWSVELPAATRYFASRVCLSLLS